MRIAVIGAGAMGSIYGGRLSLKNEVYLIATRETLAEEINSRGLKIEELGGENIYHPKAVTDSSKLGPMDLVILFVKATASETALSRNAGLIGPETRLMTLQNGAGHEDILGKFAPPERIIIGTTEDNGAVLGPAHVRRGGEGRTNVGMLTEDREGFLPRLKESFDSCGFQVRIHDNIQYLIWDKLFTNVSLSAVTGILQVDMGYIAANPHAWDMTCRLIHEAVLTARAAGMDFDEEQLKERVHAWDMTCRLIHEAVLTARAAGMDFDEEQLKERVRLTSLNNPQGCTSIRADLRSGKKTEVNTISGAVVRAAHKYGLEVPCHEFVVNMVHAMEEKGI